jgi:hypothetical protein
MISGMLLKPLVSRLEKTRNDLRYAAQAARLSARVHEELYQVCHSSGSSLS